MKQYSGYDYDVSMEQIRRYQKLSVAKRLAWLLLGNRLRKACPRTIVSLQDKLRGGRI